MAKGKPTKRRASTTGARTAAAGVKKGMMKLKVKVDDPPSPRDLEPRAQGVLPSERLTLGRMVETNGGSCLESVPGFDVIRARTHGLLTPAAIPGSPHPRAIGDDGFAMDNDGARAAPPVAVADTTAVPWRCIAMLTITYERTSATGTAWFLGERALGTAGHNIRHPVHGLATGIVVSPGYNGSTFPFGTYPVEEMHCDPAWMNGSTDNPALDFGVLVVGEAVVGKRLGWFGLAAYDDKQLDKLLLNVSGYPTDRRVETQYFSGGRLQKSDPSFLHYSFSTSAGMSGAPIFALFDQQRVAVGIHTSALDRGNRARRIDRRLYDFLNPFTTL
jgi:glutamyl endopeptidase